MISHVIAGEHSGGLIKRSGAAVIIARKGKKIKLNKDTIESYEVITDEHQKSAVSGVVKGVVGGALLGGVGLLAGALSASDVGIYQVSVEFKDGTKSLLKMDGKLYNRFVQEMF